MPKTIQKPKVVVVEGHDEVQFVGALVLFLGLKDIQIERMNGRDNLGPTIKELLVRPGHARLVSIGIMMDADNDPQAALQRMQHALRGAHLPTPEAPLCQVGDRPRVVIAVIPSIDRCGMLEDLCLDGAADDPAMVCVNGYFDCLAGTEHLPNQVRIAKGRVRTFLASREMLEEAVFTQLQDDVSLSSGNLDDTATASKTHSFLASRYKPDLHLGIAAREGYFDFGHPAFQELRRFLKLL